MGLFRKNKVKAISDINIGANDHIMILGDSIPDWLSQNIGFNKNNLHTANPIEISSGSVYQITNQERSSSHVSVECYCVQNRHQIKILAISHEQCSPKNFKRNNQLFNKSLVDYIYFDLKKGDEEIINYLYQKGYELLEVDQNKILKKNIKNTPTIGTYLAVSERINDIFFGNIPNLELFISEISRYGIALKGVLHIGAHSGDERKTYKAQNISPVVFVEANPKLAKSLREKFHDDDAVVVVEAAASDSLGTAVFNVTNMDQSSSLLPLKEHSQLYPTISVTESIIVQTTTIDIIVEKLSLARENINFLVMDIQGAELLALKGADEQLKHIEAIQLEINYDELYEGCPLVFDVDDFLYQRDFIRVKTRTPYNEKWGDALYVRRPKVTFSKLGKMGRFANQAFQYIFLHMYANDNDYDGVNPTWAGDDIFHIRSGKSSLITLPSYEEKVSNNISECEIGYGTKKLPNTDIAGFFQYHMSYYAWKKQDIWNEFQFKNRYNDANKHIVGFFNKLNGPVAAIHLRRGDYGYEHFFIPPNKWYIDWLKGLKSQHPNLQVFIATDDLESVKNDFYEFNLITSIDIESEVTEGLEHAFFIDFAAMVNADFIAISNSTFSFFASLLNQKAKQFFRPSLTSKDLIEFEPWDSKPLLRDRTAEKEGEEFMSETVRLRRERRKIQNKIKRAIAKLSRKLGLTS